MCSPSLLTPCTGCQSVTYSTFTPTVYGAFQVSSEPRVEIFGSRYRKNIQILPRKALSLGIKPKTNHCTTMPHPSSDLSFLKLKSCLLFGPYDPPDQLPHTVFVAESSIEITYKYWTYHRKSLQSGVKLWISCIQNPGNNHLNHQIYSGEPLEYDHFSSHGTTRIPIKVYLVFQLQLDYWANMRGRADLCGLGCYNTPLILQFIMNPQTWEKNDFCVAFGRLQ